MDERSFEIKNAPTWVKVFSAAIAFYALVLILSGFNDAKSLSSLESQISYEINKQKDMLASDTLFPDSLVDAIEPLEILDSISNKEFGKSVFHVSDETKVTEELFSNLKVVLGLLFIALTILLFVKSEAVIKITYVVLALSIVFSLTHFGLLINGASSFIEVASSLGKIFGVVPDIIFIIVFAMMNKSFYRGSLDDLEQDSDVEQLGV